MTTVVNESESMLDLQRESSNESLTVNPQLGEEAVPTSNDAYRAMTRIGHETVSAVTNLFGQLEITNSPSATSVDQRRLDRREIGERLDGRESREFRLKDIDQRRQQQRDTAERLDGRDSRTLRHRRQAMSESTALEDSTAKRPLAGYERIGPQRTVSEDLMSHNAAEDRPVMERRITAPDRLQQHMEAVQNAYEQAHAKLPPQTQALLNELNGWAKERLGTNLAEMANQAAFDLAGGNAELLSAQLNRLEQVYQGRISGGGAKHLQAYVDLINNQLQARADGPPGVSPVQVGTLGFGRGSRFFSVTQGGEQLTTGSWNVMYQGVRPEAFHRADRR